MANVNAHGMQCDEARWIRNWLAGCSQRVINQTHSDWTPVTSGVPQCSVLGPLLFLIYINDLDNNIISKISKFANNTKLCHKARYPEDIIELQEDINKLEDWANKWQMKFNVDKCAVMHIGHKNINDNYTKSNQQLPVTEQQRDLGIIITKDQLSGSSKRRKVVKLPIEYSDSLPAISSTRTRTDAATLLISCPSTPGICSTILVPSSTTRHN